MVYICDEIWKDDLDGLDEAMKRLPQGRLRYAMKYRRLEDRAMCTAAYLLLRFALKREYGIYLTDDLLYSSTGKPSLKGYPEIEFSISHSHGVVACAVSNMEIGIDVEEITHADEAMLDYCCNEEERQQIALSESPDIAFTQLWTKKESYVKCRGAELSDLKSILTNIDVEPYSFATSSCNRYICTVCSRGSQEVCFTHIRSIRYLA